MKFCNQKTRSDKFIGKVFKKSKKVIEWELLLMNRKFVISLSLSFLSRKYELRINNSQIKKGREYFSNIFVRTIFQNFEFVVTSDFQESKLKINGKTFQSFVNQKGFTTRENSLFESEDEDLNLKFSIRNANLNNSHKRKTSLAKIKHKGIKLLIKLFILFYFYLSK